MSKTVKNLLLVFTLVCAIALVAFCIELFVLNSGAGEEGGPALTETPPDGDGGSSAGTESTPSGQAKPPPGTSSPGRTDPADTSPSRPPGKRYELAMLDNTKLVLYADKELFEYSEPQDVIQFTYTGEGSALLEIGYNWIPPQGVNALAERFLDGYLDGGESNVGGDGLIRHSQLNGVFISGVKGAETYEAWLHSSEDASFDDLVIYFIINYSSVEQRNALYSILDSLETIPK